MNDKIHEAFVELFKRYFKRLPTNKQKDRDAKAMFIAGYMACMNEIHKLPNKTSQN